MIGRHGTAERRIGSGDHAHGKPPFEGAPGRTLWCPCGGLEQVVEVVRDAGAESSSMSSGSRARCGRTSSCELPSGTAGSAAVGRRRWPRACRERPVMAGLGGPDRDPECRGHVGQRHPEVVVQDDDRALVGRQAPERPVDQVAVGDDGRDVGREWVRRAATARPRSAGGRVVAGCRCRSGRRAPGPGFEAIGVAERRQIAPRPQETVLDRVSREFMVPEDQSGGPVQPRDEPTGQHREGVMIASLRSLDELSLVHGPPSVCRRDDLVALDMVCRACRAKGSIRARPRGRGASWLAGV